MDQPSLSAGRLSDGRKVCVRMPRPADAEQLVAFSRETAEDYGNLVPEPEEAFTDLEAQRSTLADLDEDSAGFLLAAFVDGSLAGTVTGFSVGLRKITHVLELGLAVRPGWKRLGLGRLLLKSAIGAARDRQGVSKLVVRVFASNEPALALYRAMGFVEEGRQLRQYVFRDGTAHDCVWLALFI